MSDRILSIDALRGFTMIFIIGLAPLIVAICNLFPGEISEFLAIQMNHVEWDGLRHHDTLFPTFLFIAGMTFPFSYSRQIEKGKNKNEIYRKVFIRAITLVVLGLVYNGFFRLDFEHLRCASVLGRIGLAWMFAAIIFINFKLYYRIATAIAILIGYWLISVLIPVPDIEVGASALSMDGCLAGYIDRMFLPGRLYKGTFDPEGLFSTIPAIVTAMLGMFTGEFIRSDKIGKFGNISGGKKSLIMGLAAILMFSTGLLWNHIYPINKALWSSSFVIAVGGISLLLTALFYYIIDVRKWKKWAFCFEIIGLNSITIYLAQEIFDFSSISRFFFGGFAGQFNEEISHVILTGSYLLSIWLFLYFLYRQKIFIKI